ncbi:MAG: TIGR01212 family radical SAM protein [Treponema bryantii]|nr:TIGR01212 family radical SAM protein [Treponema bryantii]
MMTVSAFYKSIFGNKVYKISLDAGCTCPNRDGTIGTGGCIFCSNSGSGDFVPSKNLSITKQIEEAKKLVENKIKNQSKNQNQYIAYFQNFTNTYGNISILSEKWNEALSCSQIVGIALGTRPDCLGDEVLQVLSKLANKTFLQIELGFQTSNETSSKYIRRGFSNNVYFDAVKKLKNANPKIHIVTHVIFGLPGETEVDMLKTVKEVVNAKSDGIKITSLYILKNTDLATDYFSKKFEPIKMDEYFSLIEKALKIIPENMVIHRLTGDPPKNLLIEPTWTTDKKRTLNMVNNLLSKIGL